MRESQQLISRRDSGEVGLLVFEWLLINNHERECGVSTRAPDHYAATYEGVYTLGLCCGS